MPACACPIDAWPPDPQVGGSIVFSPSKSYPGAIPFRIPCGRCMPCRINYMTHWSTRMVCESYMHQHSWFITTTYSDQHLPSNYSLNKRHHQLFMKRFRFHFNTPARFVCAGEYGTQTLRPHYHYIIFGPDLDDLQLYQQTLKGHMLYTSPTINSLWQLGQCYVARFTRQTGSYVAAYITKRFKSSDTEIADAFYTRVHPLTGEISRVMPEFLLASRRPGIGTPWFEKYGEHLPYDDFIIIDGMKRPVPPYFLRKLGEETQEIIKRRKKEFALRKNDHSEQRLLTRYEKGILDDADHVRKGD